MNPACLKLISGNFCNNSLPGASVSNVYSRTNTQAIIFLKIIAFFWLFIIAWFAAYTQPKPVFNFLQDDSLIKKTYYKRALENNTTAINALAKENKEDYKIIYTARFKEVEDLLTSSRSLTAAVAHNYLQSIVQKIIAANPELGALELRVIFSRDWWPNAYSMGEGTIALNAGLVVFLDNEAELIFVLCHELSHYYLNHSAKSIKKYIDKENSEDFQKELKRLSKQAYGANAELEMLAKTLVFDSRKHSRTNEAEADGQAFKFMKNTGYDCHAILSTLQLLDKVDSATIFKPINVEQVFNFSEYPFKKKWIQKESGIFSEMEENDSPVSQKEKDSLKTHPDCTKRISLLQNSISTLQNNGKLFLVNETFFKQLKKDFMAEITEQCYVKKNLSRNLYYNLSLLQAADNIPMAVYSVARCLNEIYEKQQQHKLGTSIDKENKNYPADYNQLLRLLDKLRLDEIAEININFCTKYQRQMKDDAAFIQQMIKAINNK